jgi:hypothetical protein
MEHTGRLWELLVQLHLQSPRDLPRVWQEGERLMLHKTIAMFFVLMVLATVVLWLLGAAENGVVLSLESKLRAVVITFSARQADVAVFSAAGDGTSLFLSRLDIWEQTSVHKRYAQELRDDPGRYDGLLQRMYRNGFFIERGGRFPSSAFAAGCPPWFLVLLFGLYPALAFTLRSVRLRRRRRRNQCIHCGYNLTGNVSGICPECGRAA